jgi:ribosome biogenesis GTPase
MKLEEMGWQGFFARQAWTGVPARVAGVQRGSFTVWTEQGQQEATARGLLRSPGSAPVAGDWVALRPDSAVIKSVFERRTVISRKQPGREMAEQVLAANVDVLFLVCGLDGDYNERRLERYLVLARASGARPLIVLNKADVAPGHGHDAEGLRTNLTEACVGVPVIVVSARTGEGLAGLRNQVAPGETAALMGSSGAGKSTLVNRLLGEERQVTQRVRPGDDRGRHTTTGRTLFRMPGGWLLLDQPGLREVQLWATAESLDAGFDDIRELARGCRFRDCLHRGEPGCAVAGGGVDGGRLGSYQKLKGELEFLERKGDKRRMSETRARWKVIHKAMRKDWKRDG